MDAVDCALVEYSDEIITLIDYQQYPIRREIHNELKSINKNSTIETVTRLDVILGKLFANAALKLIRKCRLDAKQITAIGCHGQTIMHHSDRPDATTLQIGDPNLICYMTGITTVADFRRMDIAAGGEGAPLTPIFHERVFRDLSENRVILNIGGITNITILPSDPALPVTGFDVGPGNVLMDAWINQHLNQAMDNDGKWAASSNVNINLMKILFADNYFKLPPPKSTGRDYFNLEWLENKLQDFGQHLLPADIQATLADLTTQSVADAIKKYARQTCTLIVCGGGVHNSYLMTTLQNQLPDCKVSSSKDYGFDPDAIEAMTFALLARYRLENIPGNIPSVTGADHECVLGAIYRSGKSAS
jgi:anhydro-N-acetylmuramic acid kinase